jgi:hypothetical protein
VSADATARTAALQRRAVPWTTAIIAALTLLALALRVVRLPEIGLWYDEAFGLLIARQPWGEMNRTLALDVHPPLWFWLLHLWGAGSVTWARLFGVVCGAATVPVLWLSTRRALGEAPALFAAGLLAVHPIHVFYSQELRMYAFQGLLIAGLIGVALGQLRRDSPWLWAAIGLLAWCVLATQYLGGAVVGALWLGMLLARWGRLDRRWLLGWLLAGVVPLVLVVVPLLRSPALGQVGTRGSRLPLGFHVLRDALEGTQGLVRAAPWEWFGWHGGALLWAEIWVALLVVLAIAGVRVLVTDPGRRPVGVLLGTTLFGGLTLLILYQAAGFLFFTRFYVVLVVPAVLLFAAALMDGPRWWRASATALVVLMFLSDTAGVLRTETREVSARLVHWIEVRERGRESPPILCSEMFLGLPLRALLPQSDVRVRETGETSPAQRAILGSEGLAQEWPWPGLTAWLVLSGWGQQPATREDLLQRARRTLSEMGDSASTVRLLHADAVAGGFKWAAIVEVR